MARIAGFLSACLLLAAACGHQPVKQEKKQYAVSLITLNPGHFHAALVQKSGYPEIDPLVHVYAPAGPELAAHLDLIKKYNTRKDAPTSWQEEVCQGPDFLSHMFADKAGNVVVIAGNNQKKTAYIKSALDSGFNVLADKPMAITPEDFSLLEQAFGAAAKNKKILYDIMTERFQITNILQKELAAIPELFGTLEKGTADNPAVSRESLHHFYKEVSGKPLIRPSWYFDVKQEGDGIVDVSTHLVDMIQWGCFPEQSIDYKKDIRMLSARRWSTLLTPAAFRKVSGLDSYPDFLMPYVKDSILKVYANGEMTYTLKGVFAHVLVKWNFQAPEGGGDTDFSLMRGSLSNLVIRQGKEQQFKSALSIEPVHPSAAFDAVAQQAIGALSKRYPGLSLVREGKGWTVVIPQSLRLDHEGTFAEVMKKYLLYLKQGKLPEWEVPDMLSKYYTTITALQMAKAVPETSEPVLKKYTH